MASSSRNLSVLAYAQGFTLWHYRAANAPLSELAAPDYFHDAGDLLARGDIMLLSALDGGRVVVAVPGAQAMQMQPLA